MRLNNKGQALAMLIILFPLILLILAMVYDIGGAYYEKSHLDNTCYDAVRYGLDNIDNISENDLIELIMKNTKDINKIEVDIDSDSVTIKLNKSAKGLFSKILNIDIINISSNYKGSINDNEKKIERVG